MAIVSATNIIVKKVDETIVLHKVDDNPTDFPIPALSINYENGVSRIVVILEFSKFSFENKKVKIATEEYLNIPSIGIEAIKNNENLLFKKGYMVIDDNEFVYSSGPKLSMIELQPYEDDLNSEIMDVYQFNGEPHERSFEPKRYNQKLKDGLVSNFDFWFSYLKPTLIDPILNRIAYYAQE